MKDIDFDELDKAVSSLMGTTKSMGSTEPVHSTASQPPSSGNDDPIQSTADTEPTQITNPVIAPAQKSIVSQRKSGRFMDVVHPSSDMKSAGVGTLPKRRTVPMIAAGKPAEKIEATPVVASDLPRQEKDSPAESPKKDEPTWPDPIELHEQTASKSTSDAKKEDTPVVTDPLALGLNPLADTPKTSEISASSEVTRRPETEPKDFSSPFLPNAKVEKRPLGGDSDDAALQSSDAEPSTDTPDSTTDSSFELHEKEANTMSTAQQPIADPLPEELKKDIIAVEAGHSRTMSETPAPKSEPAEMPIEPKITEADGKVNLPMSGATSITQQYKITPTNEAAEHAPIYDSSTQPLSHPAKAKSGWLTVLWILGLVLLGVGGAAALYFLNIV